MLLYVGEVSSGQNVTARSPGASLTESTKEEAFYLNLNTAQFWKAFIVLEILQWGDTVHNIFRFIIAFQFCCKGSFVTWI